MAAMNSFNIQDVITLAIAAHGLALAIANLTPTPRDNEFLRRFYKVVEIVAGIGPMAKR